MRRVAVVKVTRGGSVRVERWVRPARTIAGANLQRLWIGKACDGGVFMDDQTWKVERSRSAENVKALSVARDEELRAYSE